MSEQLNYGKAEDIDRRLEAAKQEAAEIILETTRRICEAEHLNVEIKEAPEFITLILKDSEGRVEREMGFMKAKRLPLGNIEEVVEARLRFPDQNMAEVIKKIREEKNKNKGD